MCKIRQKQHGRVCYSRDAQNKPPPHRNTEWIPRNRWKLVVEGGGKVIFHNDTISSVSVYYTTQQRTECGDITKQYSQSQVFLFFSRLTLTTAGHVAWLPVYLANFRWLLREKQNENEKKNGKSITLYFCSFLASREIWISSRYLTHHPSCCLFNGVAKQAKINSQVAFNHNFS